MTPDEIQKLKALIIATAMYFGHEIPDAVLPLYAEDLSDLPFDDVYRAIGEIRRDPRTTRFPLPAAIREKALPGMNPESAALEAVSRVIRAVSRVGPYDLERARAMVGELGWEIVIREGGWENVCQVLTFDNETSLRAQWRNLALSVIDRARAGLTEAPSLPSPTRSTGQVGPRPLSQILHAAQGKLGSSS